MKFKDSKDSHFFNTDKSVSLLIGIDKCFNFLQLYKPLLSSSLLSPFNSKYSNSGRLAKKFIFSCLTAFEL